MEELLSSLRPSEHNDFHGQLQLLRLALYDLLLAEEHLERCCEVMEVNQQEDVAVKQLLTHSTLLLRECKGSMSLHMTRCENRIQFEGMIIPSI